MSSRVWTTVVVPLLRCLSLRRNKQLFLLKKKRKISRNRILLKERPFNLKSSPRLLEDAFNTHVGLVYHAILSIYLMEEVRVLSAALLPSLSPPLPRSPHRGKLANRRQRPRAALTYGFCRLLEFWVASLGNIRARQPPLLSTISETGRQQDWDGRGGQPRGKRKRLLLTIHSELALVLKTTALPHAGAPPRSLASAPICSNRLRCGQERKRAGRGEMANRLETNQRPQAHLRETFISLGAWRFQGLFNKM